MPRHAHAAGDVRPADGRATTAYASPHVVRGGHADLDSRATADFLAGEYRSAEQAGPAVPQPRLDRPYIPLLSTAPVPRWPVATGYLPLSQPACAIVLYDLSAGVSSVVAPFPNDRTANQYAVEHTFASYDVVPATTVWLPSGP
jgi:hypothetical protein